MTRFHVFYKCVIGVFRGRQTAVPLLLLLFTIVAGQTNLLVCLPGKQNTQVLQDSFDALIGPSHVMVLGRTKELEVTMPTAPDAAIIAFAPFFDYVPGYSVVLTGKNKNESGEKYFIVTASKEISKVNIAEKKVGVLDLLFNNMLPRFVMDQFNIEIKFLKRVNKEDDLLTMLGLEVVDAIIVSSAQYKEILSNTKMALQIVATSKNDVGFAVFGVKEGKMNLALKQALLKSSKVLFGEMGIDSWEIH